MFDSVRASPHRASDRRPGATVASEEAALNTARAQLADWVTCPSARTPEGKQQVEACHEKVVDLRRELERTQREAADARASDAGPRRRLVLGSPTGTLLDAQA